MKYQRRFFLAFVLTLAAVVSWLVPSCKVWDELTRQVEIGRDAAAATGGKSTKRPKRVVLHTRVKEGVPVHPSPGGREVSGRIFSGIEVTVLDRAKGGKWLLVRTDQGLAGWVSRRYVWKGRHSKSSRHAERRSKKPTVKVPASSPWESSLRCAKLLGSTGSKHPGKVRLATWNLRWFPYGSTRRGASKRTDIDWMACAMASIGAQAFALQEIVRDAGGQREMRRLLVRLDKLTGGRWLGEFDDCPGKGRQHVGVLWDSRVLRGKVMGKVEQLNPGAGACAMNLRPGFAVYLKSKRGGLDFHLVSVHLDSGTTSRDYGHRRRSVRGIAAAYGALFSQEPDHDMLVMGDFNTMGCEERGGCRPAVTWQQEVRLVEQQVMGQHPRFRALAVEPRCTEYYHDRGQVLDQVLVSAGMAEAAGVTLVHSGGVCGAVSCGRLSSKRVEALRHLSDHCPVVVDLPDKDDD